MQRPDITSRWLAWSVPVFAEAAALCRSIAFAWLIGADELGRAMMLALTVRLIEMASDVGIERLIVQAPDGNTARLQSQLHGVAILRGVVGAAAVLALSPVLAAIFPGGPPAFSYAALAAIPLIRGAVHLDFKRMERHFRYHQMAVTEAGATCAMAICILPAIWFLGDYRAMAAVLLVHAAVFTLLSHLVAERPYALRLSAETLGRSWRFGAPLIFNALLLFVTFYADRLIVARAYDWASVAIYGVALQLALLPAQIVGRAASSLVLPVLRKALARHKSGHVWRRIVITHSLLALGVMIGFSTLAPPIIDLVYGPDFRPATGLALALAIAAVARILRTPYSQLAVATGRTSDPARANIIRALALLPALAFAMAGFPLAAIAAAAALGEIGATLRAVQLAAATLEPRVTSEALA